MLIGEYNHSLDPKGRVSFPAKFREELGDRFIVTKGPDQCLKCYSMEMWEKMVSQFAELPVKARNAQRMLFGGAFEAEVDGSGRILIPPAQRTYAGILRDVTILGLSTHAEIWAAEHYAQMCESYTSEDMIETLEELGF